jgi:hypothetical protein
MTDRAEAELWATVREAIDYALLQAEFTFDPLIRDGHAGGEKEHRRMVKAGIAGTPSVLTLMLRDAKAALAALDQDRKAADLLGEALR